MIRSLSERESTAAAERWHYIQAVLERRRRENVERRERFILQPLMENNVATNSGRWGPIVAKSILKARGMQSQQQKRNNSRVHFNEPAGTDDKLPALPLSPTVSLATSSCDEELPIDQVPISTATELSLRLPPLCLATTGSQEEEDETKSWAERQVVKVRRRKLWCLQEQNQQRQTCHDSLPGSNHRPPQMVDETINNLSNGQKSSSETWNIPVDKRVYVNNKEEQRQTEPQTPGYNGWPEFPRTIAEKIQCRRRLTSSLLKTLASGNDKSICSAFIRRRLYGKKILTLLLRRKGLKSSKLRMNKESTSFEADLKFELEKSEDNHSAVAPLIPQDVGMNKELEADLKFDSENEKIISDLADDLMNIKATKQVRNALMTVDGSAVEDCRCVHRAVLSCLLPDTSDSLGNLEKIRLQLRRARQRRQQQQQQN